MRKRERNKIYLEAMKVAEKDFCSPYWMCHWLIEAQRKMFGSVQFYLSQFPEIYRHKPDILFSDISWFDPDDKDTRIKILKQAIEETK